MSLINRIFKVKFKNNSVHLPHKVDYFKPTVFLINESNPEYQLEKIM